ncbi:hypothetical protein ENUP19_0203G0012 [Entamoeba nuttalli]|uniref:Non-structural maintenance of chromosomes element 4 n=2 Tax=Entamoeba nuttalli TaxID=412467 RepID=K2HQ61_ENTNP|nr:Nse4 protein [Entamoeba nuttalli P19]EKE38045.1 Nse4 protein [Entamoeba nuttalli P19]|eukprot:XP_008859624.1 Nse4 protein [Entamoeba nuttalli P19]
MSTPNDRSAVRKELREIMQEIQAKHELLSNPDNDEIINFVDKAGKIFDKIDHPREAALDAECFTITSGVTLEKSQRLKTGFKMYDISSFITRFRDLYSENNDVTENQLIKFGKEVLLSGWKVAPSNPLIRGIIIERKTRERKKTIKSDVGEAIKPKTVNADEWSAAKETPERIKMIKDLLTKKGEMPFFQFVLNVKSFGQTVENIFYTSFLIKEGTAFIVVKNRVPYISISTSKKDSKKQENNSQTVCTLEYEMWKEMVDAVSPNFVQIIPHREVSKDALKAIEQYNTQKFYDSRFLSQPPSTRTSFLKRRKQE